MCFRDIASRRRGRIVVRSRARTPEAASRGPSAYRRRPSAGSETCDAPPPPPPPGAAVPDLNPRGVVGRRSHARRRPAFRARRPAPEHHRVRRQDSHPDGRPPRASSPRDLRPRALLEARPRPQHRRPQAVRLLRVRRPGGRPPRRVPSTGTPWATAKHSSSTSTKPRKRPWRRTRPPATRTPSETPRTTPTFALASHPRSPTLASTSPSRRRRRRMNRTASLPRRTPSYPPSNPPPDVLPGGGTA